MHAKLSIGFCSTVYDCRDIDDFFHLSLIPEGQFMGDHIRIIDNLGGLFLPVCDCYDFTDIISDFICTEFSKVMGTPSHRCLLCDTILFDGLVHHNIWEP